MADPTGLHRSCEAAGSRLLAFPAGAPSQCLIADKAAEALVGRAHALGGLALLVADPARPVLRRRGIARQRVPDWLPTLVNAGRAVATIGAVALLWIFTTWPGGATAITWAAITIILMAPRADQAYAHALRFTVGNALAAVFAAILAFTVLPQLQTFTGFCLALCAHLVPAGALMAQPWEAALFTPMVGNSVAMLVPAHHMSYDPGQFYNAALGLVGGCGAVAVASRLLPPLPPTFRGCRLLVSALRDLRSVAAGRTRREWEGHFRVRLSVMPEQVTTTQCAQLLAAMSVGTEIIRLREITHRFGLSGGLNPALATIAQGDTASATADLARFAAALAARAATGAGPQTLLRARGSILAISEVLTPHAAHFDAGAPG